MNSPVSLSHLAVAATDAPQPADVSPVVWLGLGLLLLLAVAGVVSRR